MTARPATCSVSRCDWPDAPTRPTRPSARPSGTAPSARLRIRLVPRSRRRRGARTTLSSCSTERSRPTPPSRSRWASGRRSCAGPVGWPKRASSWPRPSPPTRSMSEHSTSAPSWRTTRQRCPVAPRPPSISPTMRLARDCWTRPWTCSNAPWRRSRNHVTCRCCTTPSPGSSTDGEMPQPRAITAAPAVEPHPSWRCRSGSRRSRSSSGSSARSRRTHGRPTSSAACSTTSAATRRRWHGGGGRRSSIRASPRSIATSASPSSTCSAGPARTGGLSAGAPGRPR